MQGLSRKSQPLRSFLLSCPQNSGGRDLGSMELDTVAATARNDRDGIDLVPPLQTQAGGRLKRKLRLLTFTTLFPNDQQPNHGIFVENRLRHLVESGEAESTVVAPVPYFPSSARYFGQWSRYARVVYSETRHGVVVHHPRFPTIPRIGMIIS